MTLIDAAERLSTLADEASAAADAGSLEAALREVRDRLNAIRADLSYGILEPEWWEFVPVNQRTSVRSAGQRAAGAIGSLVAETDHVLAAYGRGAGPADRGAFAGLLRAFRAYGGALRQAQDAVIHGWRGALWPVGQRAELEVHALVPETAEAAREVLASVAALAAAAEEDRNLSGAALTALSARWQSAQARAAELRTVPVPPAVLAFFTQVGEQTTVPLSAVSPEVLAWLDEHDATRLFVVGRSDR